MELAFPGEHSGISSSNLPHDTQPPRAASVPWQGTQQASLRGARGGKGSKGLVSFLCPVSFCRWREALQGAVPSPRLLAHHWGSPLLFFYWALGQGVQLSQMREGQECVVLPAASWRHGPSSKVLRDQGHPKSRGRVLFCSTGGVMSHTWCRAMPCHQKSVTQVDRSSSAFPALIFRNPALPWGCSCSKLGREDEGRWCVGSVVSQTLVNVTSSYFKVFILLPSDKNVLWSKAYHVQFGTWGGQ